MAETGAVEWARGAGLRLAPGWLERPAGTVALLGIIVVAAVGLSVVVWHALVGPPPIHVPVTAGIVSPIVGLPVLLYLQHVIHHVAESERKLTRLTTELTAATAEAERASRVKSDFLARMSHELRTPLNAVIGYSEMLIEDVADGALGTGHAGDLERIRAAGRRLLSLVDDVLDLSNIEAGRMETRSEPIELALLIDEIAAEARPLMAPNRNELMIECAADLGTILGDAAKLRQVVLNLLSIAAKFTEHGRVSLGARRECRQDGDWISIAVGDTGIGIERATLARLFTNFTQGDAATAVKYGGTGLGLALSRRLLWLMGGEIAVESEPGRGSRFTLRLPASPPGAP